MESRENIAIETLNALLARMAQGDEAAFAEIFNHYSDKVYHWSLAIIHNGPAAEDIVQEIFLKLWNKKEQLSSISNFDGYLYRATRNQTFTALKKIADEATHRKSAAEEIHVEQGSYSSAQEEVLTIRETALQVAIDNLLPQQRRAFDLCQVEGLTHKQAAEQMNISPSTLKFHLTNARDSLRRQVSLKLGVVAVFGFWFM